METTSAKLNEIKEYYGKVLSDSSDLKTSACCTTDALPDWQKDILNNIEDEVVSRFYGCGSPIPLCLEGKTVLDLGCGTGRDVFMASKLVGETGHVIGIDMTEEQLEVGRRVIDNQMKRFGFETPNVSFLSGYIEHLDSVGLEDNSVDVLISNCVINLSPDKKRVFSEIFRVLKPGGELYFSDVFTDRRIPKELQQDPVLYGECLSGAMYVEDFRRLLRETGCLDYRVLSKTQISLDNPEIEEKAGMINFYSMTIRAFKLNSLEDICEDFGQVATYRGTIPHARHTFELDDHHIFTTGKPMLVCGNTAAMLEETRYSTHFKVTGDRSIHFGAFNCEPPDGIQRDETSIGGCC